MWKLVFDAPSSRAAPTQKLNNGKSMPVLGLGTWLGLSKSGDRVQAKGDEVEKAVEWAIDAGYKHIDIAFIYNTETQVGKAINKKIADGVLKRKDLFVTTKLWNDKHAREDVVPALRLSLEKLGLDYVDLYLIHWPISIKAADDAPLPRVDTPELVAIAQKHNKTVTQVTLRYLVELGVIPIPKTKSRVEENFNVFDFSLTEEERNLLKSYDRNYRTLRVKYWANSKYYPFEK